MYYVGGIFGVLEGPFELLCEAEKRRKELEKQTQTKLTIQNKLM